VHRLYRMATGELNAPLRSTKIEAPIECKVSFDFAITHNNPLLFLIKRHLHVLLTELANVNQALISLEMVFETDLAFSDEKFLYEKVCPASPSLDETQILGLVRLKLESQKRAPIISMKLVAKGVRASLEQTRLFHELSQSKGRFKTRDLKAGERALARVGAQFGDDTVLRSVVNDGHLPETKMRFEPLKKMCLPQVSKRENTRLVHAVRRIFSRAHDVGAPRGMYVASPFWVSGGWWSCEVRRAYHYIDDESGTLDWVYFDERKGCWRRQGIV